MARWEWLRDLESAEKELSTAKTKNKINAIQIRIKEIKHYIEVDNDECASRWLA